MQAFVIDVDVTNREIQDGEFVVWTRRVVLSAKDDTEATLIAAQMVAANSDEDDMVTATRLVI